jgi:hypothetical protein
MMNSGPVFIVLGSQYPRLKAAWQSPMTNWNKIDDVVTILDTK